MFSYKWAVGVFVDPSHSDNGESLLLYELSFVSGLTLSDGSNLAIVGLPFTIEAERVVYNARSLMTSSPEAYITSTVNGREIGGGFARKDFFDPFFRYWVDKSGFKITGFQSYKPGVRGETVMFHVPPEEIEQCRKETGLEIDVCPKEQGLLKPEDCKESEDAEKFRLLEKLQKDLRESGLFNKLGME